MEDVNKEQQLQDRLRQAYKKKRFIKRLFDEEDSVAQLTVDGENFVSLVVLREDEHQKTEEEKISKSFEGGRSSALEGYEAIHAKKEEINIKDIFKVYKNPQKEHVFINGRAGIGKSTFCQRVAYQWATGELFPEFEWVFWIQLRTLTAENFPKNSGKKYEHLDLIRTSCLELHFADDNPFQGFSDEDFKILRLALPKSAEKILFLLDGYDELNWDAVPHLKAAFEALLKTRHVVITSRPLYSVPGFNPGTKLEITGFNNESIEKYIRSFYGGTLEKSESLITRMKANSNLWGVSYIPINLEILCHISKDGGLKSGSLTFTAVYEQLEEWLLWRHHKNEPDYDGQRRNLQELRGIYLEVLVVIQELAFNAIEKRKIFLEESDFENCKSYTSSEKDKLLKLGFVKKTGVRGNNYYFIHLTFQEFFAARHIVEKLKVKDKEIVSLIRKNKYNSIYEIIWWFVAGLLVEYTNTLSFFFELLAEKPYDLLGIYHDTLLIRCLEESRLEGLKDKEQFLLRVWEKIRIAVIDQVNSDPVHKKTVLHLKVWFEYFALSPNVFMHPCCMDALDSLLQDEKIKVNGDIIHLIADQQGVPEVVILKLLNYLRYEHIKQHHVAVYALQKQKRLPESIQLQLTNFLHDKSPELHWKVRCILEAQTFLAKNVWLELEKCLEDEDDGVRHVAVSVLGKQPVLAENTLLKLEKCLRDPDNIVRINGLYVLGSRTPLSESTLLEISYCLQDEALEVRRAALKVVEKQTVLPGKVLLKLEDCLEDENVKVRRDAVCILGKQTTLSEQAVSKIFRLLEEDDPQVRTAWALTLRAQTILSENVLLKLHNCLQDENSRLLKVAALILSNRAAVPNNVYLKFLNELHTENYGIRSSAAFILGELVLPENIVFKLFDYVSNETSVILREFASAASVLAKQKSLPEGVFLKVKNFLLDENTELRETALIILRNKPGLPETILLALVNCFNDQKLQIRRSVIQILRNQTVLSQSILLRLEGSLEDVNSEVRVAAISVLGKDVFLPESRRLKLENCLHDENPRVRACAISALWHQKDLPESVRLILLNYLEDEYPEVQDILGRAISDLPQLSESVALKLLDYLELKNGKEGPGVSHWLWHNPLSQNILLALENLLRQSSPQTSAFIIRLFNHKRTLDSLIQLLLDEVKRYKNRSQPIYYPQLWEIVLLKCLQLRFPIYIDTINEKNIFIGKNKILFETWEERNEFIQEFMAAYQRYFGKFFTFQQAILDEIQQLGGREMEQELQKAVQKRSPEVARVSGIQLGVGTAVPEFFSVLPLHSVEDYLSVLTPHWPQEYRNLLLSTNEDDAKPLLDYIRKKYDPAQSAKFEEEFQYLLLCTAYHGSSTQTQALVNSGFGNPLNGTNGFTVLHMAALKGDTELFDVCCGVDFSTDQPAQLGPYSNMRPMHCAIVGGHGDIVKELMSEHLPSQITYKFERECLELNWLSLAVYAGQQFIVEVLLEVLSADKASYEQRLTEVSAVQSKSGGNLLHIAVESFRHWELGHLLSLEYFRRPNLLEGTNTEGLTPFGLAAKLGNVRAMFILKEKGAAIDSLVNSDIYQEYRPLHLAEESGNLKAVTTLLSWKADGHTTCQVRVQKEKESKTPAQLAEILEKEVKAELVRLAEREHIFELRMALNKQATVFAAMKNKIVEYNKKGVIKMFDETTAKKVIYKNLVFKGGGPKGIAYVGALVELAEKWKDDRELQEFKSIERAGGASAGAIIAAFIAVGLTPQEMKTLMLRPENHPRRFLEGQPLGMIGSDSKWSKAGTVLKGTAYYAAHPLEFAGVCMNLAKEDCVCSGDDFLNWMDDHIEKATGKKWCTFGELKELIDNQKERQFRHLHLVTIQVNPSTKIEVISSEDPYYKDYIISHAIRGAMSIPVLFAPAQLYRLKVDQVTQERIPELASDALYIDGGVLANYPLNLFDKARYVYQQRYLFRSQQQREFPVYNEETLGFYLEPEKPVDEATYTEHAGKYAMWNTVKGLYSGTQDYVHEFQRENLRSISIGNAGVGLFDFNLTEKQLQDLLMEGEGAVRTSPLVQVSRPPFKKEATSSSSPARSIGRFGVDLNLGVSPQASSSNNNHNNNDQSEGARSSYSKK